MKKNDWKERLNIVYSTNPDYEYEITEEVFQKIEPKEKQLIKILLDKRNRGGKKVSLVTGFQISSEDLDDLCRLLKVKCGVGGSAKNGEIIIQGDFRERILEILRNEGYLKARMI
ncbi:MAG: translation initiation factor [Bacteroidales bacterium]|nr:translation initiation factor [Bacteroidales bacterium]